MNQQEFINQLTKSYKPSGRLWSYFVRASLFLVVIMAINITLVLLVQPFRPNYIDQFINSPWFMAELFTVFVFIVLSTIVFFKQIIPGEQVTSFLQFFRTLSLILFVMALMGSFVFSSVPSSALGVRALCDLEVLIYGGLSLVGLFFSLKKGLLPQSRISFAVYGLTIGLLPAALMQIACMYNPIHALTFHYGPILILSLLAAGLFSICHQYKKNRSSIFQSNKR